MSDTRRRMAKGAFWTVLLRLTDRSIGMVSTLFLARLLAPADFGLIAMAMSIVAMLEVISTFSFDIALIQNPTAERRHYDTAWTFNVLFGLVNACLLLALAGPVATFYAEPRSEKIMMWLALYAALQGFVNIGMVAFQKDLELHKEFSFGLTKRLISFTVTMTLAFSLRNYWALVAGTIVSSLVGVVLSYWVHPYRPRFSLAAREELFHFSKWMLINNVLIFLCHRSTDLVIGRVTGAPALGLYNIAYEVSNLPTTELVFPISRAVFPGYAKMAASLEDLRQGFLDVLSVIVLFAVPAGLGIMVVSEPLVYVVLGAKWKEAIPLIQMLSVFGVLRASVSNSGSVYLALGIPKVMTYLALLFLALMAFGLWAWVPQYGAPGAAAAVLLAAAIQIPVGFVVVTRKIALRLPAFLGALWRPLIGGVVMVAVVALVRDSAPLLGAAHFVQLATLVPLGASVYVAAVLVLWSITGRPNGGEMLLLRAAGVLVDRLNRRAKAFT